MDTMKLTIDLAQLAEGAEAWWRSLSPGTRGVFLQACWEIEQCPEPRTKDYERMIDQEIEDAA